MKKLTKPIKIYDSFSGINFKGESLKFDEPAKTKKIYFQHLYAVRGFMANSDKVHVCLRNGHWCWSNFRENPKELKSYLKAKLRTIAL